ncbi:Light-independent protochlorophyllide reductase subunit N [Rubrobacter xylanophilus DSM 9941]|uniref:nitrogenase component 1 n=1 Tax=Rubrobacter xylanophilus TaxID=49319 RepID=UPI001C63D426|nr:nitrogenase component 1 [Rubrobacter xylanophilus]QYJ16804.1 Light-independent protochlorophyllide reductase subunit N [Rubrobacter xylanophilus DSM 9941]
MTILNESGVPDVLPPLGAAGGLAERLPGLLVVVAGTRSEAHLLRCVPPPPAPGTFPPPRSPRVLSLLLDPEDPPEQGRVASGTVEAAAGFRGLEAVLLVAGRVARRLGMDAGFEARLAARRLELPVLAVDPDEPYPAPGVLSTDLEDRALAALLELCPEGVSGVPATREEGATKGGGLLASLLGRMGREERRALRRPVVLLGAVHSPGSGREVASELARDGVEVSGTVPAGGVWELPPVGEGTLVAALDPNLGATLEAAERRGAEVVRTLCPIGVDGTARFIQEVADAAGSTTSELGRARAVWQELQPLRNRIRGKRIFFAGDTGLEVPLARFLADAGAVVLEVGAPRLDRRLLSEELRALGPDVDVVESPDWRGQLERIERSRPDLVVASPGLYAALVARGQLCRCSRDFLRLGVHGYGGARRVLEFLVRALDRAEALDSATNL